MKFSKKKYLILGDVGEEEVLLSEGIKRFIIDIKEDYSEVVQKFFTFNKEVINNCEKAYFLSKKINDTFLNDFQVSDKLLALSHKIKPCKGVVLLPTLYNRTTSFGYQIERPKGSLGKVFYQVAFYTLSGIEYYFSGYLDKNNEFIGESIYADDIEFIAFSKNDMFIALMVFSFTIILFMQFAEIETVITVGRNSKGKSKAKIKKEKYLNESDIPIEIIDSTWFRRLIRTGKFKVSGHFRLQPYGKGRSEKKLIWIDEFNKNGYKTNPKMLTSRSL